MVYYKRSPFLFTYWNEDNKIILYNYNSYTKAIVTKQVMRIIEILSEWRGTEEIYNILNFDMKNLRKALNQLVRLKIIHKKPLSMKDTNFSGRARWDPVDLAMQRQRSYGGAYPMSLRSGKSPSPIKHVKGLYSVTFQKESDKYNNDNKRTLQNVLEARRSIRNYSNNYINVDSLSHFLYNSARIKKIFKSNEGTLTQRPYPSGGARYPLEIYVVNNKISDIQKGIYYYDPLRHKIILLNRSKNYQRKFNDFILQVQKPAQNREPDVILIITAVFARTMWKYSNIAYSLIMSDLGCLYQTMYLVATEMNLAPCPLGGTYETLVRDWLNLNWFEESHVGTFMLAKSRNMKSK